MAALFGWQGLSLQHPDDWAPVALSGDRRSGYVRLASPRALSLQIRWAPAGTEGLERALNRYLDRLSRDARRKRQSFSRDIRAEEVGVRYRYRGEIDGDGLLFPTDDGRIAFLEALGESTTARGRALDRARESFATDEERWSVHGLDFRLPGVLRVERREFFSGRSTLVLAGKGVQVTAERWGLANELLTRMSLPDWVTGRLGRGWAISEDGPGLRTGHAALGRSLTAGVLASRDEALILHQSDKNQIVLLRARVQGPAPIPVDTLRKAKPVRHPDVEWEEAEDGSVLLQAPLEGQGRGITAVLARRMNLPPSKGFELEPVGAFVWLQCDGVTTVETIGKRLRERYKMSRVEADTALGAFLQTLSQRRLIVLTVGKNDGRARK